MGEDLRALVVNDEIELTTIEPMHPTLELRLDAWLASEWSAHVGRKPKAEDFLFLDASGSPFREERCDDFLADVERAGCETIVKGLELDIYSLRHTFATAARRAGISSDARDRLLGHRPKDTKGLHYEDEDLPLLAAEIAKLPPMLDAPAAPIRLLPAVPETAGGPRFMVRNMVAGNMHASGGTSVSLTISAEEERFELPEGLHPRRFSKARRRRRK